MVKVLRWILKFFIKFIPNKKTRKNMREKLEKWYEQQIVLSINNGKLRLKLEKIEKEFPSILTYQETLDKIILEKKSIIRFGDGELNLLLGRGIGFQKSNLKLKKRLKEILKSNKQENLICLFELKNCKTNKRNSVELTILAFFQEYFWIENWKKLKKFLNKDKKYGNANITRVGVFHNVELSKIKKIWEDKEVIFVYSKKGRFDKDKRLFNSIKSYEEIFISPVNAFDDYDKILKECKTKGKEKIFLISAGPTATILAYDLSLLGYQAIDIGHFPNCYQQYLGEIKSPELLPKISD